MKEHYEIATTLRSAHDIETPENSLMAQMPYRGYGSDGYTEDKIHLRDYWRSVRKHWKLVAGVTALTTILAFVYMARKADIYEAQARVQVDLENINSQLGASKGNSIVLNSAVEDPRYFSTQLEILSSPVLLRRVVRTLDLEHNKAFLHPELGNTRTVWQNIKAITGFGGNEKSYKDSATDTLLQNRDVTTATAQENLVEANRLEPFVESLQMGLTVKQIKDTRLISIRFTHPNPEIASKVVNAIADTFVFSNLEKKTETNSTTGDFLQKRIAELQSNIRSGEEKLINYGKSNQILSLDENQNTVVDRLSGLNKQLLEAENERKLAEAAYNAAKSPGAADALAEATAKHIMDGESKLVELRQKRAELLVDNTEDWPAVKEIEQQIAVLENQVETMRRRASSTILTNLETAYRQALAREGSLRDAFSKQRAETLTQNEAAVNYHIIQQEIETNKSLLSGLLQRSKENEVEVAGTSNNIHVNDYALMPKQPIGPKRLQNVIVAFLLALGFGISLALFLEYLDDTVRSPEDVETMFRLPTLAVIPSIVGAMRASLPPAPGTLKIRNGDGKARPIILPKSDHRSALSEAYRQLRTAVLLSTAGRAPKTLLVTSSLPAEGKTTTTLNTALSLAQTGVSVLVIDADMRRPKIHSLLNFENKRGLSTILSSDLSEPEILNMILQHQESGLHVLTSGPIPPNPAELLGSDQMRRLLTVGESTFAHVIIDSPPLASFTDGVLLSSIVDGVLLVVHSGKTARGIVRRSRQLLNDVGAKIFGVVLNNVKLRPHDYYYSYYHSYYEESDYNVESAS